MKSLRTLLIPAGLAAVLALPAGAFAQSAPAPAPVAQPGAHGHHRGGFMHLMKGLNLTADQQSRIKALMTQFHQSHPKGSAPDPQAREALHQQILGILTPQQQTQFNANLQAARAGMNDRAPGGGMRGAGMMRRFDQLNLSADQKARIQALMTQFHQAHPAGSARDPQAMAALHQQINAILTPQQQAQLQQMRGHDNESQENPNTPQR